MRCTAIGPTFDETHINAQLCDAFLSRLAMPSQRELLPHPPTVAETAAAAASSRNPAPRPDGVPAAAWAAAGGRGR